MTVAEMDRQEVIELVASTLFRVTGVTYFVSVLSNAWHLKVYNDYITESGHPASRYDLHLEQLYVMDIIYDVTIALIMILLSVQLGRLVCRGLRAALELKADPKP